MKKSVNKFVASSIVIFILIMSLGVSISAVDDEYIDQDINTPSSSSVPSSDVINDDVNNDVDDIDNGTSNDTVISEDDTPDYIYYNNIEDEYVPQESVVSSQYVYDDSTQSSVVSKPYSSVSLIAGLENVDDPELSAEDWNISLDNTDGTGSFDFIKNADQYASGNAKWMLYVGIGLIVFAVLGILFVVIDYLLRKQKNSKSNKHVGKRTTKTRNLKRPINKHTNNHENIISSTQEIPQQRDNSQWDSFFKD